MLYIIRDRSSDLYAYFASKDKVILLSHGVYYKIRYYNNNGINIIHGGELCYSNGIMIIKKNYDKGLCIETKITRLSSADINNIISVIDDYNIITDRPLLLLIESLLYNLKTTNDSDQKRIKSTIININGTTTQARLISLMNSYDVTGILIDEVVDILRRNSEHKKINDSSYDYTYYNNEIKKEVMSYMIKHGPNCILSFIRRIRNDGDFILIDFILELLPKLGPAYGDVLVDVLNNSDIESKKAVLNVIHYYFNNPIYDKINFTLLVQALNDNDPIIVAMALRILIVYHESYKHDISDAIPYIIELTKKESTAENAKNALLKLQNDYVN